jgi:hypothetical protein
VSCADILTLAARDSVVNVISYHNSIMNQWLYYALN